jgi:membrane protease YdiL (CAAX protease family)
MNGLLGASTNLVISLQLLAALAASGIVWVWIAGRRDRGRAAIPYEPRRPVPWGGAEVLLLVLVYFVLSGLAGTVMGLVLDPEAFQGEAAPNADTVHFIARLAEGHGWVFLLAVVSAALVAPVFEEFFFRVVLQGWLEASERQWRKSPAVRQSLPRGLLPVVASALAFAAMHFRRASDHVPTIPYLVAIALASVAVSVVLGIFAVVLLRFRAGATAADLGWSTRSLSRDIGLGLLGFLAVAGPLYLVLEISAALVKRWQWPMAPDPLPIFVLALGMGTLYYRTHRLVPCVAMHMALNVITLSILLVAK